jgi:hypothetical protein
MLLNCWFIATLFLFGIFDFIIVSRLNMFFFIIIQCFSAKQTTQRNSFEVTTSRRPIQVDGRQPALLQIFL